MTRIQVMAAFQYAFKVTEWCKGVGLLAAAQMCADGSGKLMLWGRWQPNGHSLEEAQRILEVMLHSERWHEEGGMVSLSSSHGWHEGWEETAGGIVVGLCQFFDPIRGTCARLGTQPVGVTLLRCPEHKGDLIEC